MITGLHHVAISVSDLDRSTAFYREMFGLTVAFEWEFAEGRGLNPPPGAAGGEPWVDRLTGLTGCTGRQAMLRAPNAHIELFEWTAPTPAPRSADWRLFDHGINHVCFQVDNLDAWHTRLSAAGVDFDCPPQTFLPVKNTYARDPDGNIIELLEPLEAGVQFELPRVPATDGGFDPHHQIEGIHHVGISVSDLAQTLAFYSDNYAIAAVGPGIDFSDGRFDRIWNTSNSAGMATFLNLGNAWLEVFAFEQPVPSQRAADWRVCDHGFTHFCFQIADVATTYAELSANDVVFNCPPGGGGRVLATYSHDAEGNLIELMQVFESGAFLSIEQ